LPDDFSVFDLEFEGAFADAVFEDAAKLKVFGDIQTGSDNHDHFAALVL